MVSLGKIRQEELNQICINEFWTVGFYETLYPATFHPLTYSNHDYPKYELLNELIEDCCEKGNGVYMFAQILDSCPYDWPRDDILGSLFSIFMRKQIMKSSTHVKIFNSTSKRFHYHCSAYGSQFYESYQGAYVYTTMPRSKIVDKKCHIYLTLMDESFKFEQ